MNLFVLFVVAVQIHRVTPLIHSLIYFTVVSYQIPNFPEYLTVGYIDGVPISHYDSKSRKAKAKQDWMNKITADDPHYWEKVTQDSSDNQHSFKVNFEMDQERLNQTGGLHMFQVMSGCEWDDETDEVDGFQYIRYNGEDFIAFELETMRWIAVHPQSLFTKHRMDQWDMFNQYRKHYYTEECPSWLKKFVNNGRDFLMRTEIPKVSLLQKTPSSPVTCHATGFYPDKAELFWRKDGEQLHEDVEVGETLRNHDGTFQTTADLKMPATADVEGRYECVFRLSGVKDDIVTKLEISGILSNARIREEEKREMMVSIAVPLAVLAPVVVVVLVKLYKSRQAKYTPASVDADCEPASKSPSEPVSEPASNSPASPFPSAT
ncbi:major histocompatibility complex class I-related gene protein-like isoform X2 [Phycodurus eques]|uniref:major histocompatibility complex class I-related gene protein-like isoform X2 n=1 Tax=Phycodurus eques TaxID=693459 RepID=UPI002ACD8A49|nr:major histocompatibility complex class I-related gene protein-like isoform X2 [Phycodurus eques]